MPDMNLVTRVNGVPYSWNSCAHFFNGIPYKGITASNYKETREVKLVHAGQQDGTPLGMTAGMYKVESTSFRLLRDSASALMIDLNAFGVGSYGDAEFNYVLQLYEPVAQFPPALPVTVLLAGCRVTGVEEKQELGVDELVTEFTVQAKLLVRTVGGIPVQLWSAVRALL